jgi:hypothetical protein
LDLEAPPIWQATLHTMELQIEEGEAPETPRFRDGGASPCDLMHPMTSSSIDQVRQSGVF